MDKIHLKQDRFATGETRLCEYENTLLNEHRNICNICRISFEEFTKFGLSNTPPCQSMLEQMREHVNSCKLCGVADGMWNEDAIPIIPEMREIVESFKKNQLPSFDKLKTVQSYLFKELMLSSNEIKDMSEKADRLVRKSLEDDQK